MKSARARAAVCAHTVCALSRDGNSSRAQSAPGANYFGRKRSGQTKGGRIGEGKISERDKRRNFGGPKVRVDCTRWGAEMMMVGKVMFRVKRGYGVSCICVEVEVEWGFGDCARVCGI